MNYIVLREFIQKAFMDRRGHHGMSGKPNESGRTRGAEWQRERKEWKVDYM